jgi:alkanesulfonate monooxygenase SsuD/methylene tetrahydromethanopterin reductase-like flavin-dependent oxidoreductase (luciferase family)
MTIGAGIGIANFPFNDARGFWRWVDLCDNGGIDSIWQSDRIIGADKNLEVMSVMAALAGGTSHVKFGMNVASLGLRDPVLMAKQCATIDVLSEGRLLPAFGIGSSRSRDYSATNTPTAGRGRRMDEGLEIIKRLWTQESVSYDGDCYQLNGAAIAPKPIQHPMPLWIGGSAAKAIERTARWGTGWQAGIESADKVGPVISAIKAKTKELGRTIDDDHFGAGFGFRFGSESEKIVQRYTKGISARLGKDSKQYNAIGGAAEIMELLQNFLDSGAHKFILRPIASDTEDMIQQTKLLIEKVLPEIALLN